MSETVAFLKMQLEKVSTHPDGFNVDATIWAEIKNLLDMYENSTVSLDQHQRMREALAAILTAWERPLTKDANHAQKFAEWFSANIELIESALLPL